MPHASDSCLNKYCKHTWAEHDGGGCTKCPSSKCQKFEFTAPSTRKDKDILVSATFQSKSGPRIYVAIAWKQGDFSCTCKGWANNRTCWHIDDLRNNPKKYKNNKTTTKVVSAAETQDIMSTLQSELATAKSNPALYSEIKNKIQFFQTVLSVASESLDKEMQTQAQQIVEEMQTKTQKTEKVAPKKAVSADDPFGE